MRVRYIQEGPRVYRANRRDHRRTPDRRADGRRVHAGARANSAVQSRAAGGLSRLRLPRGRGSRQHVPVQAGFPGGLLRGARSGCRSSAESRTADLRTVADPEQGPNPARVTSWPAYVPGDFIPKLFCLRLTQAQLQWVKMNRAPRMSRTMV